MASQVKMNLPSADDLFSTQATRDDAQREKVQDIPLTLIDPFPEHPFQIREDEAMLTMTESVKAVGVLTPAVARQKEDGRYELVSGHRRKRACELARLETMPVLVREMTHDEAVVFMVESNFQRETVLPSEKAFAYKMRLDAMKRQAGRPSKENSVPVGQVFEGKTSREILATQSSDSNTQIQRFIRLTSLIPDILQLVDNGKIAFRPAVELSYLQETEQAALLDTMQAQDATPSLAQAQKMKLFSQEGKLTQEVIQSVMMEEKPNQREKVTFSLKKFEGYFKPGTPIETMEKTMLQALDLWIKREKQRQRDARG